MGEFQEQGEYYKGIVSVGILDERVGSEGFLMNEWYAWPSGP